MTFRSYEKIYRLGKDEVEGILDGTVIVQEKIDGANTSIWRNEIDKNGTIILECASRNQQITKGTFNGFLDFIFDSPTGADIHKLLNEHPTFVLYGEWLVKHTVSYRSESYKEWYMFDIFNRETNEYLPYKHVRDLAVKFSIKQPRLFAFTKLTEDELKPYVGMSELGPVGEGIVIKREDFVNKWGNRCHAKMVRQEFLEDHALLFNSNNKTSESYTETYIVNKYLNAVRLEKILNKLQPEINEKLDLKHIPRITNTIYYDMVSEEGWEIAKLNKPVDFKILRNLAMRKAKLLYIEHLEKT